ncbi:hypothetical protein BHYA_0254g00160 [Botrytis hyacinthi]|uniref:Uncharacterized protein n=1 Tax=Botrytis hyacinthi TaxID=278943 RepID=A0A4Z1GH54_9HELO|nr:hypothetical protein BHYA_0254g00160 [Botrytis hyacinthi]
MTSDEIVEKGSAKKTGMHQESYKVESMLEAKNKNTYIYAMQVESLDVQVETREVYV